MQEPWTSRRASLRDRDTIAYLCRAAVGEDDYLPEYLDDLILRGVTFVAFDDARIVGTMTYHEALDGTAWLSGARTHPDYQRRGVARALVSALENLARLKGLKALRLWTEATNEAGIATFQAAGFLEVARIARFVADASGTRAVAPKALNLSEDLWASIEASAVLKASNGYAHAGEGFVRVDRPTLHALVNRRLLLGWNGNGAVLEPYDGPRESVLGVHPVFGDVREILRAAPALARAQGHASVETFLPHARRFLEVARSLGYAYGTWAREAILCEKSLSVSTVVLRKRKTVAEINASKRSGYGALARLAPAHGHGQAGPHEDRWNP